MNRKESTTMNSSEPNFYVPKETPETTSDKIKSVRKKSLAEVTVRDITMIGVMVAVIEVCKVTMASLPNIELTTFWIIMFTLFLGKKSVFAVPVLILIEGTIWGFGLWWVMYLYIWPMLALLAWIFQKQDNVWFWSILSSLFGLAFGFLSSFPYFFIGLSNGGITGGLSGMFSYWIAGIPFDITHGVSNFVLMLVLYKPVRNIMKKAKNLLLG